MKILSWNVNGIRAAFKKGFLDWLIRSDADIVCVQETKTAADQFPQALTHIDGYHFFSSSAEKKGYSGVAVWTRHRPEKINTVSGNKRFDTEGRLLHLRFKAFDLFNVYFPNGGASEQRLRFKLGFYNNFLKFFLN